MQTSRIEESEDRGWRLPQGCLRLSSLSWLQDPYHDPLEDRQQAEGRGQGNLGQRQHD